MMIDESRTSDLPDPLANYSGLSLFNRSLSSLPSLPKSNDRADDVETTNNYLKSLALRDPHKLLEQAKTIIDSGSEVLTTEITCGTASKNRMEALVSKENENPRERRPALGRKRARFCLRSGAGQPADNTNLQKALDIDKYPGPEEFFLAFERIENAKKEIQKQTGSVSVDPNQQNTHTVARPRRQGILGRSANYKHLYQPTVYEKKTNSSSQEMLVVDILNPSDVSSQPENVHPNTLLQETDVAASAEEKVSNLLDELLSCNDEDLDGDGAVMLLQERLQLKPVNFESLCLPDLQNIRRTNNNSSEGNFSKRRSILTDRQNILKGRDIETPEKHKQEAQSCINNVTSVTPSKSPLASLLLLKKHALLSSHSNDTSAQDIDQATMINSSISQDIEKQSDQAVTALGMSDFGPSGLHRMEGHVSSAAGQTPSESITEHFSFALDRNFNDISARSVDNPGLHCANLEDNNDENSRSPATVGPDIDQNDRDNTCSEGENKMQVEDMTNETNDSNEKLKRKPSQSDQSIPMSINNITNESPEIPDVGLEQPVEDDAILGSDQLSEVIRIPESNLGLPTESIPDPYTQSKPMQQEPQVRRNRKFKAKGISRRQSLAAAGTSWKDGVRRSTRIRTRPLEFWRGERLLYGRVHGSLVTVIGMKYVSTEDGKPNLKVKSYVSDEHKDLVEQAALH